jgi:hypothetical protein
VPTSEPIPAAAKEGRGQTLNPNLQCPIKRQIPKPQIDGLRGRGHWDLSHSGP